MDYHHLMNLNCYIEFCGLTEPETNCLRLYFARCKTEETAEDLIIGDTVIKNTYPIIIDKDLPVLQLDFESYIAYSVTNESFTSWDEYEQFEGKHLGFIQNQGIWILLRNTLLQLKFV